MCVCVCVLVCDSRLLLLFFFPSFSLHQLQLAREGGGLWMTPFVQAQHQWCGQENVFWRTKHGKKMSLLLFPSLQPWESQSQGTQNSERVGHWRGLGEMAWSHRRDRREWGAGNIVKVQQGRGGGGLGFVHVWIAQKSGVGLNRQWGENRCQRGMELPICRRLEGKGGKGGWSMWNG